MFIVQPCLDFGFWHKLTFNLSRYGPRKDSKCYVHLFHCEVLILIKMSFFTNRIRSNIKAVITKKLNQSSIQDGVSYVIFPWKSQFYNTSSLIASAGNFRSLTCKLEFLDKPSTPRLSSAASIQLGISLLLKGL